jgi:putative inorganic carbon (hco3(-)) transporter
MVKNLTKHLEKIIFLIIKGIIFLLPLFFLPWSNEYFEFNKQFLLWLTMPVALSLWFIKALVDGQIKIKNNPLNLPIFIFLLLTFTSSIFSIDKFSSFFGYFGRFSDAWLGLLSLVIFYFLIINSGIADSAKKIIVLLKIFIYSSAVVNVTYLLAIFGVFRAILGHSVGIFSSSSFNLAGGSPYASGIFLTFTAVVLIIFLLSGNFNKFDLIFLGVYLIIFLLILLLINFSLLWLMLSLGAGLAILFYWLAQSFKLKKNYYILIPFALILIAIIFLARPGINPAKIILGQDLPKDALITYGQSFNITKETLKNNPILGSGPGTFSYDFSRYRSAEFNKSALWQIRFDKNSSHLLEILAMSGLLSFLSLLLIVSLVFYLNLVLIKKYLKNFQSSETEGFYLIASLFTIFILVLISQIFFLTNTVLNFCFWFFLSLNLAFWQLSGQPIFKEKNIDLKKTTVYFKISFLFFSALGISLILLLALEIKFFTAEIIANQGINREKSLLLAIKLNPYRPNYYINLAKFYMNSARAEALKTENERNNLSMEVNITQAISFAKQAVKVAPYSVLTHETLGAVYRDVRPLTIGSELWAVKSFSQALELEPTNPVLASELAKAFFNNNDLVNAEKYFLKALELKSDYYDAKFDLAKVYLKGNKDQQALILLNELVSQVYDVEVYFELGRFYYNHGEIDKAIERFKLILSLAPKHSNSLYSLAVAYEAKGDIKEALKYYGQVLELNQDNLEVKDKIKSLNNK